MTKLQKLRKEKGMTQQILAEKTNIPFRTLQHYERGEFKFERIGAWAIIRIANALDCSIADLFDDDQAMEDAKKYDYSGLTK